MGLRIPPGGMPFENFQKNRAAMGAGPDPDFLIGLDFLYNELRRGVSTKNPAILLKIASQPPAPFFPRSARHLP
jgi:hypothetical protein